MIKLNGEEIQFETFPNGETRIVKDSFNMVMNNEREPFEIMNEVLFKYENDGDLIKLMFVKKHLDSHGVQSNLAITYMPYSRMDRVENNSIFTLKHVSEFINSLNFYEVIIVEPHSDVTPALVDNAVSAYVNFDLLPEVMEEVEFDKNIDYIFFPDAGASKRYQSLKGFKQLVGHKNRNFETGEILNLQVVGELTPMSKQSRIPNVIIVDDLSSYGGTFVHSAKALKELGFNEIYLLVAHAENSVFKGELFDHIDKLFTTDSILTEQNNWANAKFKPQLKVYEIEDLL